MAKLFNKEVEAQIKEVLAQGKEPITVVLFTKTGECNTCEETKQLLVETAACSELITLVQKDIHLDKEDADKYGITLTPSFVILDKNGIYKGVKFNGIPAGHEINSFISALLEMSGLEFQLPAGVLTRIQKINKPVNIKVFVTLSCPHCPGAVQTAHRLAMLNKNIVGEMIEAQTFYDFSSKYNVSGVPKIVINDKEELLGNQPLEAFLDKIDRL
jgi:glutaredoxin-like protein